MVLRDGELITLEVGDLLLPGDVIEAGDNASAEYKLIDGSTATVESNEIAGRFWGR